MKKVIEMTDTIRDIAKKSGIPEIVFRNANGRKIRYDCTLPALIKKSIKK